MQKIPQIHFRTAGFFSFQTSSSKEPEKLLAALLALFGPEGLIHAADLRSGVAGNHTYEGRAEDLCKIGHGVSNLEFVVVVTVPRLGFGAG